MAFYGKAYKFHSQENFDGFLKASSVPEDKIQGLLDDKPTSIIEKNGDTYTVTTKRPTGDRVITFKSGEEFDDIIGSETKPAKNIITIDGNVLTQRVITDRGTATFKKEYNGDDLVVTITSDKWDGVARRYYKA